MGEINIGPKVTRYTLKPAEGVKLSRITALNQDLALALAAHPIRIEAPIPGKSLVGIEVPNKAAAVVRLGSLMGYPDFQTSGLLGFCLGRDVTGEPIFANIEKMPHLLIAGSTGSGKTCGADTYIFSEKGMLTFKEACPLALNSEKEFQLKVATRDGVETTSKSYNNGVCDFYRIETQDGYHIEVTAEHPLWVINESGEMKWKPGGQIKPGDYVAISRGSKLFGSLSHLNFQPSPNKTNKPRPIKIPSEMTPELGLLLGLLTADGGLTVRNRVVYTQADNNLLRLYQNLLKNLFGIAAPVIRKSGRSNKAKDIVVHSVILKEFLSYLGMQAVGAQHKEIPKFVRMARPEVIKAFFRGLVRNDGHLGENSLEISLASFKLLEQMQIMLLNFGIVSSLKQKRIKNYPGRKYWRLAIYGKELVRYAEEVGFLTAEEKAKIRHLLSLKRNPNKDVVPNVGSTLKKLGNSYLNAFAVITNHGWQYRSGFLVPKHAFTSLHSYVGEYRRPSYTALRRALQVYRPLECAPEYKQLQKIVYKNFYWAEVKDIRRSRGEGYDFEVPGSNSFVGNGFVNHNSVAIHSLIVSLLYKNSPATLKMILIDPKRVELTVYENLPHLVSPVITEAKKTIGVFRWALSEMDRRYELLQAAGSRDIASYNKNGGKDDPLPYLLIIVDELADLMASYGREVEGYIVRLAQMARATGLHLVLSTQRPSVEVITGLIKANITSRIALQVASQVDSRTILDTAGAEKLLGGGDLLFLSSELSKPKRIQGAYISEEEIHRVADFIRENNFGLAAETVSFGNANGEGGGQGDVFGDLDEDGDELYDEAVETVRRAKKASASLLQRRLKVGYARAARLLDLMEERGVIGPGEGAKPREVYLDNPDA
jgi:intein/homing endonuclease